MAKVKAKFRARKRYSVEKDKYKIRTFIVPELPKSNDPCKPIDMTALIKIIDEMIDEEFPDTCNKLLWLEIIKPKEGETE